MQCRGRSRNLKEGRSSGIFFQRGAGGGGGGGSNHLLGAICIENGQKLLKNKRVGGRRGGPDPGPGHPLDLPLEWNRSEHHLSQSLLLLSIASLE